MKGSQGVLKSSKSVEKQSIVERKGKSEVKSPKLSPNMKSSDVKYREVK